jgi:hypothetical protein
VEDALYLLEKAQQCRRLAAAVANQRDPAVRRLLSLAQELEAQAGAHIANKQTAQEPQSK